MRPHEMDHKWMVGLEDLNTAATGALLDPAGSSPEFALIYYCSGRAEGAYWRRFEDLTEARQASSLLNRKEDDARNYYRVHPLTDSIVEAFVQ